MQRCKKADAVGIIFGSQPCQWLVMGCYRQTACRRYTTNCRVAYLKARIQWPLFIQPLTWLATLLSPSGALSYKRLAFLRYLSY